MNEITYHSPGFARDGNHQPETCEFETLTDLMNLERIKKWSKSSRFSHFALGDNILLSIEDEGFIWWVVGYIKYPENINLPKWEYGKHLVELDNEIYILTNEVKSICDNKIELKDGRIGRLLQPKFGIKLK